jgi:hypothetical protein
MSYTENSIFLRVRNCANLRFGVGAVTTEQVRSIRADVHRFFDWQAPPYCYYDLLPSMLILVDSLCVETAGWGDRMARRLGQCI